MRYRHLGLAAVFALSVLAACSGASDGANAPNVFFATKPEADRTSMTALFQGPLVVRNRCVLIGQSGDYAVPIWPKGFRIERGEADRIVVHDEAGRVVATEGEDFEMGGGFVAEFQPVERVEPRDDQLRRVERSLGYAIPERCLGPDVYGVWSVGET